MPITVDTRRHCEVGVKSMQKSSTTSKERDVGKGLQRVVDLTCAGVSPNRQLCIYSGLGSYCVLTRPCYGWENKCKNH